MNKFLVTIVIIVIVVIVAVVILTKQATAPDEPLISALPSVSVSR